MLKKFLILLVIFFSYSQNVAAEKLNSIVIKGNERTNPDTIKSYLTIHLGEQITSESINTSYKKLFATELFSNVSISSKGSTLIINLIENPKINKIAFEGNSALKDNELEKEMLLKPLSIYSKSKLNNDMLRMINLYQDNGKFAVIIDPKIIKREKNRIDLVFEIKEGPKATIKKIAFIGNNSFSNKSLRDIIVTDTFKFYKFFSKNHYYNSSRIELDKELLRRFYLSHGFPDFKVLSVNAEISPDKDKFYVTYSIEEGDKYYINKVDIKSEIAKVGTKGLEKNVITEINSLYNIEEIEKSIDNITDDLNSKNVPFVNVDAEQEFDREKKNVKLIYLIQPGPKVYIGKINISGNLKTEDGVIRREFRLSEGDPYNSSKINRSEQKINHLGFFNKVDLETKPGDTPDQKDIYVKVTEKSTTSLNFAVGYDTSDGVVGKVSLNETNLFGKGQELDLGFIKAQKKFDINLGFTENYLFGLPLSFGGELFKDNYKKDPSKFVRYSEDKYGFALKLGYNLAEYLKHQLRFMYRKSNVYDVDPKSSQRIKDYAGKKLTQSVGQRLVYDKRDLVYNTTKGYIVDGNQEFAGIGGNVHYLKHSASGAYYKPVYKDDVIFKLSGEAAVIRGLKGQSVNLIDMFYLGGISLRGFDDYGIGPRAAKTDEALGGTKLLRATAEVKFPLGLPKDLDFFGNCFMDTGKLWGYNKIPSDYNIKNPNDPIINLNESWRVSVGAGFGLTTPVGPITVYYAIPIKKEKTDQIRKFGISFTSNF